MDDQYRANIMNNLPPGRPPPFAPSNIAAPQIPQHLHNVPFPPNMSAPFFTIPPPNCPPPTIPQPNLIRPPSFTNSGIGQLLGTPPTGFPPPASMLPPTNIPPPVNFPPLSVPPPCYIPRCLNPGPVPPIPQPHPTNVQSFAPNTNLNALPPSPNIVLPTNQISGHTNVGSFVMPTTSTVNFEPPQITSESEAAPAHEVWLKNWLSQRQLRKPEKKKDKNNLTVCSARMLVKDALQALGDLKACIGYLQNSTNAENDMWRFKVRKAAHVKEKLNSLLNQFSVDTLHSLKTRVKKIQAKRGRIRRKRLQAVENQKLENQNRENLHNAIDSWRNEIQEKVENEKKNQELKREADNILSEVRKKVQEAKRVLDHLDVLQKLRAARMENSQKKGLKISSASTEHFEETVAKVRKRMEHQLSTYRAEEHALNVMLETEREQEKKDKQKQKLNLFRACQQEILERLFSKPPDPSSPLFFYWQYYMQGHTDLESLIQIRHQWDMFLVPQDDLLGSPIPVGWVLPKSPSSQTWDSALHCEDPESD